jgi:hypothetical protein
MSIGLTNASNLDILVMTAKNNIIVIRDSTD